MGKWIRDGLIGIVVAMTILVVWAGIQGYFFGFVLDAPDPVYGVNGAGSLILLAAVIYGFYVVPFGLVAGLVVGWALRQSKARRRD